MNFNLQVLNLLFSLCDDTSTTPSFLRDLGYKIVVVEPQITVGGTGKSPVKCKPECLLYAAERSHVIGIESKSGACHSAEQRERYGLLVPNRLRAAVQDMEQDAALTFQLVYFCPESESASQSDILNQAKSPFALMTYDASSGRLALARGTLPDVQLVTALREIPPMPWPVEPCKYVQFDPTMSDVELAALIIPSLKSFLVGVHHSFSPTDIARKFVQDWFILHHAYKQELAARLSPIIETVATEAFPNLFTVHRQRKSPHPVFKVSTQAQKRAKGDRRAFALQLGRMGREFLTEWHQRIAREKREAEKPPDRQGVLWEGLAVPETPKRRK